MKRLILLSVISFVLVQGYSQTIELRKKSFNLKNSIALQGYDPVSYFDGKPTEGKEELKLSYEGIVYQFSTQANLTKFKSKPSSYEPQYGGWCAYAMGDSGEKVKVDPETYKILNGKLYLFYNFWGSNTLTDWNKNEKKLLETADKNWKKIIP
ncbi:MAG TPA: YHS domain-containing (seleno)protein [Chryseolinea sp.]|nr:YHS domain-containing (seleno)protein [Chryseolinea sp.]